jgi:hypothetical protein
MKMPHLTMDNHAGIFLGVQGWAGIGSSFGIAARQK